MEREKILLGVGSAEIKVFIGAVIVIIVFWLIFHPISEWTNIFWSYLNNTAPIYWLGQLFWPCFAAFLIMIGYMGVKHL